MPKKKNVLIGGIILASAVTLAGYLADSYMLAAAGFVLFALTFVVLGLMG